MYVLIAREFLVGHHFPFTYGFNIENFLWKIKPICFTDHKITTFTMLFKVCLADQYLKY